MLGGNIEEYVQMMQEYQEELNTLGQKIIDSDFAMILLTSLPESWNSFIKAIKINDQIKSTNIITHILQKDRRQTGGSGSSDQALVIKGKFHKSSELRDMLHVDNGSKFVNKDICKWLNNHGIKLKLTAPHSSAQNGITERVSCTIVEHACAMMIAQKVLWHLWPEAMAYATYIKN